MVRLDYCNALLCGAREDVIRQLERLQRQAAKVVCKKYKTDHISTCDRIVYIYCIIGFLCLYLESRTSTS